MHGKEPHLLEGADALKEFTVIVGKLFCRQTFPAGGAVLSCRPRPLGGGTGCPGVLEIRRWICLNETSSSARCIEKAGK